MKTNIHFRKTIIIALLLAVPALHVLAEGPRNVVTVKTPRFSSKLVEVWIENYNRVNPDVQIQIVKSADTQADLELVTGDAAGAVPVARYALLPVIHTENPLHKEILNHSFDAKDLKKLFFVEDAVQGVTDAKKNGLAGKLTVYSGANRASGANAFAAYFGYPSAQFRGKRIAGDDIFLLTALSKDKTGITFNNLSYLYDLQSRRLKPQLSILPLDVDKDESEVLLRGSLDEALQLLETQKVELVPIAQISFVHNDRTDVTDFLSWLLTEGQQYNHTEGFLVINKHQKH